MAATIWTAASRPAPSIHQYPMSVVSDQIKITLPVQPARRTGSGGSLSGPRCSPTTPRAGGLPGQTDPTIINGAYEFEGLRLALAACAGDNEDTDSGDGDTSAATAADSGSADSGEDPNTFEAGDLD